MTAPRGWCAHLPQDRQTVEVTEGDHDVQVSMCAACGEHLTDIGMPANEPEPEGAADPESGTTSFRHIPWGEGQRPYTPEDVEREIIDIVGRLNAGARFQAAREREAVQAALEFEIGYARALTEAANERDHEGKVVNSSADQRKAVATLACQDLLVTHRRYEQVVRTTRESMHTLRSNLSGLQTINRSVSASAGSGR